MLFALNHGQHVVIHTGVAALGAGGSPKPAPDQRPLADVAPDAAAAAAVAILVVPDQRFGYLYPDIAGKQPALGADVLDALGTATTEVEDTDDVFAPLAPILTYFGQFIDHDITANTDREQPGSQGRLSIAGKTSIQPAPPDLVVAGITNLRTGALDLDSVYGDGPQVVGSLDSLLRDGAKLRVGTVDFNAPGERPTPPAIGDDFADLPRVGPLSQPGGPLETLALPGDLLTPGKSQPDSRKAFIGDGRNDENLIVAQLHVAFLRFHNEVVDALQPSMPTATPDALHQAARDQVRHIYQWLVVNAYVRAVCRGDVADVVIRSGAPIYSRFFADRSGEVAPGVMPMPLEFSVAAFRFGHSMIRALYDYNLNFERATFLQLFEFTGKERGDPIGGFGIPTLPFNWIIDWSRFIHAESDRRRARAIDTRLAFPLTKMVNETSDPGPEGDMFRHLAQRNLRRGHLLGLPSAQAMIAAINTELQGAGRTGELIPVLSQAELTTGPTSDALTKGGFHLATPLWFYVLKEAEVGGGATLGPLGSRIVAETLVGLVVNSQTSYWNVHGPNWTPAEAVKPKGEPVTSLAAFLRAAGVLV